MQTKVSKTDKGRIIGILQAIHKLSPGAKELLRYILINPDHLSTDDMAKHIAEA